MTRTPAEATLASRNRRPFRERVYRLAIGLSVILAADGILMAAAFLTGGYAPLGYGQVSYLPVFMPTLVVALVVCGIYIHGFVRRSWTAQKGEWLFFALLVVAVAAKVVVFLRGNCCD